MEAKEKRYLLIYHREDNDGVFSAALLYDYLTRHTGVSEQSITLMGATYNTLAEFIRTSSVKKIHKDYDSVLMTDISFDNTSVMKSLYDEFGSNFVWCDHHAPVIKDSFIKKFDTAPGIRQSDRSAILCVWKYLYDQFDEAYNKKDIPELLRVLSAWDSWSYEREGYDFSYVKGINKAVNLEYGVDFTKVLPAVTSIVTGYETNEAFRKFDECVSSFALKGMLLDKYDTWNADRIVSQEGDLSWTLRLDDGTLRTACALFMQGPSNSTMFSSVADKVQHGIVFKRQSDGRWTFSLYNTTNTSDFHCGEFLKARYNGGGHPGAAGCTLNEDQFITVLKNRQI